LLLIFESFIYSSKNVSVSASNAWEQRENRPIGGGVQVAAEPVCLLRPQMFMLMLSRALLMMLPLLHAAPNAARNSRRKWRVF
jgi:hypothetical protein